MTTVAHLTSLAGFRCASLRRAAGSRCPQTQISLRWRHGRSREVLQQRPIALFEANAIGPLGVNHGKLRDDQRHWSLLPPTRGRATNFQQLSDGLWTATQPLLLPGGDAGLRMTIARLPDGSLWVHNPVAPTGELLRAFEEIGGPIAHIVVPNGSPEHWYFLVAFARQFPEATIWTSPGFFEGRRIPFPGPGLKQLQASGRTRTFANGAPEEWGGEVDVAVLDTGRLLEGAFCIRRSHTLLVSDNCVLIDAPWAPTPVGKFIAARIGVYEKLAPFFIRLFDDPGREEVTAWAEAVLALEFDTVVPSHTAAPIRDGKAAFAAAFPAAAARHKPQRQHAAGSL